MFFFLRMCFFTVRLCVALASSCSHSLLRSNYIFRSNSAVWFFVLILFFVRFFVSLSRASFHCECLSCSLFLVGLLFFILLIFFVVVFPMNLLTSYLNSYKPTHWIAVVTNYPRTGPNSHTQLCSHSYIRKSKRMRFNTDARRADAIPPLFPTIPDHA